MNNSLSNVGECPESLVLPGVRLHEALKNGVAVQEAFDTYCRRAFRNVETAPAAARFLVQSFNGKLDLLLGLVDVQHLKAELAAGSNVLCSLVSEQWDRTGNSDRLAALASAIGNEWHDEFRNPVAMEFILALAAAVAILHPEKTRILLDRCSADCASKPEFREALDEAREWQEAGELIAQAPPDQKLFWHRQLAVRVGDWVWDTAEAKAAVSQLERTMPEGGHSSRLLKDRVPGWAWNQRLERAQVSVANDVPAKQAPRGPKVVFGVIQWALALVVGLALGTMLNSGSARDMIASWSAGDEESKVVEASSPPDAVIPEPEVPSDKPESIVANDAVKPDVAKADAKVDVVVAEMSQAGLGSSPAGSVNPVAPPSDADSAPVVSAVPLAVQKTDRQGWIRTPLGEELELAKAVSGKGLVTDSAGRAWSIPADLNWSDESKPSEPKMVVDAAIAHGSSPGSATALSSAEPLPVSPSPEAGEKTTNGFVLTDASPAESRLDVVRPEENIVVKKPDMTSGTPFNLHPDYFTASATQTETTSVSSVKKSQPVVKKSTSAKSHPVMRSSSSKSKGRSDYDESKSFVTRANNIRMHYRNGVWESSPGAYLNGAGPSPQAWARDMTLRERSSGTIPGNYMFQVLNNGAVQAVPDPQRGN